MLPFHILFSMTIAGIAVANADFCVAVAKFWQGYSLVFEVLSIISTSSMFDKVELGAYVEIDLQSVDLSVEKYFINFDVPKWDRYL